MGQHNHPIHPPDAVHTQAAPEELLLKRCIGLGGGLPSQAAATAWHPSPGSGLLAYTAGCQVVLLDVHSKQQLQHFRPKRAAPRLPFGCLAFKPSDGLKLAAGEVGSPAPEICIWELSTGKLTHQLKHHRHGVGSVAFSHDGSLLLSAGSSYDSQLCLWDVKTGVLVTRVQGQMSILSASFNEDSTAIMCCGKEQIRMWSLNTSGTGTRQARASHGVGSISLMPKPVNYRDFRTSTFTAITTCLLPATHPPSSTSSTSPAQPTGMYVLTGDGVLLLLKPGGRAVDKSVNLQTQAALCLAVCSNLIACGCAAGVVRLFSPRSLEFKTNLPRPSPTHSAAGAQWAATGPDGTPGGMQAGKQGPGDSFPDAGSCQFNREGDQLVVGYSDHTMVVWDVSNLSKITRLRCLLSHAASIWDAALLPLGSLEAGCALVTCGADGTVRVWNLDRHVRQPGTLSPINHAQNASTLRGVMVAGGGKLPGSCGPAAGRSTTPLRHTCAAAAVLTTTAGGHSGGGAAADGPGAAVQLRCLRVSRDGQHLATGDAEGNVRVYDLSNLQLLALKEAHEGAVLSMDFSPPSLGTAGFLATAGRDCVVHVFDVGSSYTLVNSLEEHSAAVTSVRFSPCGSKLISASADRSLILRDILDPADCTTSMHLKMLIPTSTPADTRAAAGPGGLVAGGGAARGMVYDMVVDPSGSHLVLAVHGGLVRVYDLNTRELVGVMETPGGCSGEIIRVTLDSTGAIAACACTDGSLMLYSMPTPAAANSSAAAAKPPTGRPGGVAKSSAVLKGQLLARAAGHAEMVTCAMLIGGGEAGLVSVGGDACILHWELPPTVMAAVMAAQATALPAVRSVAAVTTQAPPPSTQGSGRLVGQQQDCTVLGGDTRAVVAPVAPQRARWATSVRPGEDSQQPAGGVAVVVAGRGTQHADHKDKQAVGAGQASDSGGGGAHHQGSDGGTDETPGSPAARDQQPVWPDNPSSGDISNTLKRVQMGLPLQSPDKLPRWAIKNIVFPPTEPTTTTTAAAAAAQSVAAPPQAAGGAAGAAQSVAAPPQAAGLNPRLPPSQQSMLSSPIKAGGTGAGAAGVGGARAGVGGRVAGAAGAPDVPCAALWTLGVDLEEDVVLFCDEGGGSGGEEGGRGGQGGAAGLRFNVQTSTAKEGEEEVVEEETEDLSAIDDSAGLVGAHPDHTPVAGLSNGVDVLGGKQQQQQQGGDDHGGRGGAGPMSGGGSNDPAARARHGASQGQPGQGEAGAAAGEMPPVARNLFRQFFGGLDQVSCSNTPQLLAAGAQAAAAAAPQGGADARRLSLTTAVRRLASSLLAAGPTGEDLVVKATIGSPAPAGSPAQVPDHVSGVRGPAGQPGTPAATPGLGSHAAGTPPGQVQGRKLPLPAAIPGEDGDGLGATSAFTPAAAHKAGCSLAQLAKDPARAVNNRAGRLEGDLAKMRERLCQLQASFAQQQARVTPWRRGAAGGRGTPGSRGAASPGTQTVEPLPLTFPDLPATDTAAANTPQAIPACVAPAAAVAAAVAMPPTDGSKAQQEEQGHREVVGGAAAPEGAPLLACSPLHCRDAPCVEEDQHSHHAITIFDVCSPRQADGAPGDDVSYPVTVSVEQPLPASVLAVQHSGTPQAGAASGQKSGRANQAPSPDLTLTSPRVSSAVHYSTPFEPTSTRLDPDGSNLTDLTFPSGAAPGQDMSQLHASPLAFLQRNLAFDLEGLNTPMPGVAWGQGVDLRPQQLQGRAGRQDDATPQLVGAVVTKAEQPGPGGMRWFGDSGRQAVDVQAVQVDMGGESGGDVVVDSQQQQRWVGSDTAEGSRSYGRQQTTHLPPFVRSRQPSPLRHLSMKEVAAVLAAATADSPTGQADSAQSTGSHHMGVGHGNAGRTQDLTTGTAGGSQQLSAALESLMAAISQVKGLLQQPQASKSGRPAVQQQLAQASVLLQQLAEQAGGA